MITVFLDIDGVLATDASYARWRKLCSSAGLKTESVTDHPLPVLSVLFDPDCLFYVRVLLAATRADVFISSSWRLHFEESKLRALLLAHGIAVRGITPVKWVPSKYTGKLEQHRGAEIADVIASQGLDPKACLILEDLEDVAPYNGRRVQTSERGGFQLPHLKRALFLLGWEKERAASFAEGVIASRIACKGAQP